MSGRGAVLLDRDGTLIVEKVYLSDPAAVELTAGASQGLAALADLGLELLLVTNQSGVGRGYFTASRLDAVHRRLAAMLAEHGVVLDGIYVCHHTPEDRCDCRKPAVGLALRAARERGLDPARCFVIGDKECDIDLGRAFGARTILVRTGYGADTEASGRCQPDAVVDDLRGAADIIRHQVSVSAREGRPGRR